MEYEFLPADAKWQALAAGETPAAFQANYSLADGVLLVTADDVKEYLDLPVLGAIPHFDSEMVPRDSELTRALNRLRGLLGDRKGK